MNQEQLLELIGVLEYLKMHSNGPGCIQMIDKQIYVLINTTSQLNSPNEINSTLSENYGLNSPKIKFNDWNNQK